MTIGTVFLIVDILQFIQINEQRRTPHEETDYDSAETFAALPASDAPLLIYLDIEKLGGGVYGRVAGQAVARVISAADMEGIALSSGDSTATLAGSANEYVIGLSGDASRLDHIEAMLSSDTFLEKLLSPAGIHRGAFNEPLTDDGIVRSGELMDPPGHSTSFCAAGFKDVWKKKI